MKEWLRSLTLKQYFFVHQAWIWGMLTCALISLFVFQNWYLWGAFTVAQIIGGAQIRRV